VHDLIDGIDERQRLRRFTQWRKDVNVCFSCGSSQHPILAIGRAVADEYMAPRWSSYRQNVIAYLKTLK
jgi:hypothetical protein